MKIALKNCFYVPLLGFAALVIFAASAGSSVKSENLPENDKNLMGEWRIDSLEMTAMGVTQKYKADYLLSNTRYLPRNLFLSVYFSGSDFGIDSSEAILNPGTDINLKGSFTAANGRLSVIMRGESQERTFTYQINGDYLRMQYSLAGVSFNIVFKCTFKPL